MSAHDLVIALLGFVGGLTISVASAAAFLRRRAPSVQVYTPPADDVSVRPAAVAAPSVQAAAPRVPVPTDSLRHTPQGERDELLRWNGTEFAPLDPPEFVPDGENPVRVCWDRFHAEHVRYDSRRVPDGA